ncbi:unnamed protein product [Didymodactylos carnosus]|uniref:Uncharacterized protein n=1 Tax=Didymodactylos carnosus TaxID=1234261 RepID=A0A816BY02_9BILA|nr:unnamed protein product [Didymodactylos carnosus]CAF1617494.1 unnamed protein product [Didymodactylos carnosus]CAF3733361.1 unnamed protein product [Didymodactylos carnosus]CAF4505294.1 unnamed protein product [Didymodactylos carnosus]
MNPELLFVNQHSSPKYPPRTYYNAKSSDVTLALAVDLTTRGEKLTHKAAGEKYLGFQLTDEIKTTAITRELYRKLRSTNGRKLNVAGNGIYTLSKHNRNQVFVNQFTYEIIAQVHNILPLERIFTGGQTGFDIAGAVAGYALGIPTEVTLPHGYIQRFENGADVVQTQEQIIKQIQGGALALTPYMPVN